MVTRLNNEEFYRKYPRVYHMAQNGSWESIKKFGLLSTVALLDKWGVTGKTREEIESNYRSQNIKITHDDYGMAVIRDQKPIKPEHLNRCLPPKISVNDWYRFINNKVFFWADWISLKWFISANEYIRKMHIVLCLDTTRLLEDYNHEIKLSAINSGSAYPRKNKTEPEFRDYETFKSVEDYDSLMVKEITIDYSLPNIEKYLIWSRIYVAVQKGDNNEPQLVQKLWGQ